MKKLVFGAIVVLLLAVGAWLLFRGGAAGPETEYRYEAAKQGEIVRSISAVGQLVALTTVDVKSKAGGKVVHLAVEEGKIVKKGDLIATIDPSDTKALFDQAAADLQAAEARAASARLSSDLQQRNQSNSVTNAESALSASKSRLSRAISDAGAQPAISAAELQSAQAALTTQQQALVQLQKVTIPQSRKDAESAVARTRVDLAAAKADVERQEDLFKQGFAAQSAVERARSTYASAQAAFDTATQRMSTLESDLASQLETQQARVAQAKAGLEQAKANQNKVFTAQKAVGEARDAVRQAELALARSKNDLLTNRVRESDTKSAVASTVRSKVSLDNAQVQLDSTTVLAPRDGVVTMKYLEEGTIIPPGTSMFSQGTSLVQIADTTRMFVECLVDEADIAQVELGQKVRIIVEAFPGVDVLGVVQRINPSAQTANNITAIKVRVEVKNGSKIALMPGMNATCEFLTLEKPNVLVVPSQAIKHEGDKTTVKVKGKDKRAPVVREVKVGETGNDGVEILEGLKVGEEVVVAEINLKELRETQEKMKAAADGGGLAAGPMRPGGARGGSSGARPSGGARPGGGGGGR